MYLSYILPTGWQAAAYADIPKGGSVAAYGLGPVGQFSARAERLFGIDLGVYSGAADPLPMLGMFDKGITVRMGQAHVRRWVDGIMPLLLDESDPLGTADMASHYLPLEQAPGAYATFQTRRAARR